MLKLRWANKERGDTIIEVMIVLTILSLALSISYATANSSLQNTRQAQENSEATKLLQGQIESLRAVACAGNVAGCVRPAEIDGSVPFCLLPEGGSDFSVELDNAPENCRQGPKQNDSLGLYRISVLKTDASTNTFTATAEWDDVRGEGKNKSKIVYRLPQ